MAKIGCDQSGLKTLKLAVSTDEQMEQADFCHVNRESQKSEADEKVFGWAWSRIGVASLVTGL